MALHRWQLQGKYTTIHVCYELTAPVSVAALTTAIEQKLLLRFPRFRGYVTADERAWCVPESVDPSDYVVAVELEAAADAEEATLLRYVQQQMALPLPPRRAAVSTDRSISGTTSTERSGRRSGRSSDGGGRHGAGAASTDDAGAAAAAAPQGWSLVEVAGVPPPKRSNHAMLPHGEGRVLIFGGFDGQGFLGDLSAAVLDTPER